MNKKMYKTLNNEQVNFVKMTRKMIYSVATRAIKLTGGPGTGKSYVMSYLLKEDLKDMKVLITAPTNKATLNLAGMLGEDIDNPNFGIMTIHKALKLKMFQDDEILKVGPYGDKKDIPILQCDICVIDEASMVNNELVGLIISALTKNTNLKIIIVGDKDQLFPPKEHTSPLMDVVGPNQTINLIENRRFGDDTNIDKHVKILKKCINDKVYQFTIMNDTNANKGSVIKIDNIYSFIKSYPKFFDHKDNRILTWTREQFKLYNSFIRKIRLGEELANRHKLIKDERFISYSTNHDENIFIGDEGIVTMFKYVEFHPQLYTDLKIKIPCIKMSLSLDNGQESNIYTLNPLYEDMYNEYKNTLWDNAVNAKKFAKKKLWRKYWMFYGSFHSVEPSYAQTVHSSQGSTYSNTIVDVHNITLCRDVETKWRLLYVAFSRAKNIVIVNV